MRVLFVHKHGPGQYRHIAAALAADPANRVVMASAAPGDAIPGVERRSFAPHRGAGERTHPYARSFEDAVLHGQAAFRLFHRLKAEGFVPDLVCAHAGFGPGLFVKESFPDTPLLSYFEWFYRPAGGDAEFLCGPLHPDDACRVRALNAAILSELAACDWGQCPTGFQRAQFPPGLQDKLTVLHDGVDTERFTPAPGTPMVLPGLVLSDAAEIVTYATSGMDPYRGFPQFLHAAATLLEKRPGCHVVVGGTDSVLYGPRRPDGRSWREAVLAELAGRDLSRLHFVGALAPDDWLTLLRAGTVHVYLTVPFVLSWSLLEAMACGACVVASDTGPVCEVMTHGEHGLLADLRDPAAIAGAVAEALDDEALRRRLGAAARDRVLRDYALDRLLPRQIRLMRHLAGGG